MLKNPETKYVPFQPFTYNVTEQLWETGFGDVVSAAVNGGSERVKNFKVSVSSTTTDPFAQTTGPFGPAPGARRAVCVSRRSRARHGPRGSGTPHRST